MNADTVAAIGTHAIEMCLLISLPMMLGALVIGVLISLFQAVTQIQEQTLTFVPKIIVVFVIMIVAAPWLMDKMVDFTKEIFAMIPTIIS